MNSALKPALPQPGVPQPGGQASPAKGNVASANHAVGLPQGANSVHLAGNSLSVQNLSAHAPHAPLAPAVPPPSMAPVSANMAQMAQNMSHHGNLSHLPAPAPGPKGACLAQPLALTRPERKDEPGPANGTVDGPKPAVAAPAPKPANVEPKPDKPDAAKTPPSTPKLPEIPPSTPSTPQKPEASAPSSETDSPAQPKVATANEPSEKSPSKPTEVKPSQAADVAPFQSDSKPVPESASNNQSQEKPSSSQKEAEESAKPEPSVVKEEKVDEVVEKSEKPAIAESQPQKTEKAEPEKPKEGETPKQEEPEKPKVEPIVEKKPEAKVPSKAEVKVTPKSTLKLATVTPPMRKRRHLSEKLDGATPSKKPCEDSGTPDSKTKRNRTKVQLYQSPTPEMAMATKLSASVGRATPTKPNDDKLIVFYKNEYLAVRNVEGGFYVCQAVQNVYRSTRKIKIRWLSQDKADSKGETYTPDFYDVTDMECVLTTLSMQRAGGGAKKLKAGERARAQSILQRALRAEQSGTNCLQLTEEHPDGLDLSLYTDESQLEKKATRKRNSSKSEPDSTVTLKSEATPNRKTRVTPSRAPPPAPSAAPSPRRAGPSTKTATALTEKGKAKTLVKRRPVKPAKVETPASSPRKRKRAAKENKSTPVVPTPSTSTGKTSRTRRHVKK